MVIVHFVRRSRRRIRVKEYKKNKKPLPQKSTFIEPSLVSHFTLIGREILLKSAVLVGIFRCFRSISSHSLPVGRHLPCRSRLGNGKLDWRVGLHKRGRSELACDGARPPGNRLVLLARSCPELSYRILCVTLSRGMLSDRRCNIAAWWLQVKAGMMRASESFRRACSAAQDVYKGGRDASSRSDSFLCCCFSAGAPMALRLAPRRMSGCYRIAVHHSTPFPLGSLQEQGPYRRREIHDASTPASVHELLLPVT